MIMDWPCNTSTWRQPGTLMSEFKQIRGCISLHTTDCVALTNTKTTSLVHKSPSNISLECNMELLLQICSGFILISKLPLLYTCKHHDGDRPLVCLSPASTLPLCIATPISYHFYYLSTGFVY